MPIFFYRFIIGPQSQEIFNFKDIIYIYIKYLSVFFMCTVQIDSEPNRFEVPCERSENHILYKFGQNLQRVSLVSQSS